MRNYIYCALFALVLLCGCEDRKGTLVELNGQKNDYSLTFLFEIDGVKVYRFRDGGKDVYFTNSSGHIKYEHTTRVGKRVSIHREQTVCN